MSRWQPGVIKRSSMIIRKDGKFKTCTRCKRTLKVTNFWEYEYTTNQGKKSRRLNSACDDCKNAERNTRYRVTKHLRTPEQVEELNARKKKWADARRKMPKRVPVRKICTKCGEVKLASKFYKNYVQSTGLYPSCIECCNTINRVSNRRRVLKRKYGVSLEWFESKLKSQDGKCAVCKINPAVCVDHDHSTGALRDLLCSGCNLAIGNIYDNLSTASNMAKYLKNHGVSL